MDRGARVNRRRFLILAGGVLATGMLSCGGLAKLGMDTTAVSFGQSDCKKEEAMKKILVAYASRCGSTAEVAQAIADRLCQRGESVDVRPVAQVKDVAGYQAVVVGSAVRMGHWLPAAVKFVQDNGLALRQVPTAFFSVHMLALDDSEQSRMQRAAYVESVRAIVPPQYEAFFPGKIDQGKMNLGERLLSKVMHAQDSDQRDWPAINSWADGIFSN